MTDHHRTFHGRLVPGGFALDKNGRELVLTVALPIADAGPVLDLITSSPRDPRVAVAIGEVAVALAACLALREEEVITLPTETLEMVEQRAALAGFSDASAYLEHLLLGVDAGDFWDEIEGAMPALMGGDEAEVPHG